MTHRIIRITDNPELIDTLAGWFNSKWGIPKEAYLDSMNEATARDSAVPEWYAVIDNGDIIGGAGVIENDFHDRPDLSPNVCALYVIPKRRGQGIAGELLAKISADMNKRGVKTLYLVTDHTSFYERYGWEYLTDVRSDGEDHDSRMYVKNT
ncbi:MAG: GNAT family N-acetyltransferase [Clostridia bacterium]|nr:GNAT family N-acetyltransferase [Clostridia bacterium]